MSQQPRRKLEREFGVPVPGEILPPEQWTQTALKKLPPEGPLDMAAFFGRNAPLVIDLGCGNGRFTLASALLHPDWDHLAIDVLPLVIRYATRRANQRGLSNVRFAVCDAERFLRDYVPPHSAREIHCYHPQPYYESADFKKRLLTPEFLYLVHTRLLPGGRFFVQTDHGGYWRYLRQVLPAFFELHEQHRPWPDAPKGRTRREIIALRRGLPVYRAWGAALPEITEDQARARIESLPRPDFPPERHLQQLDAEERRNDT